MTNTTNTADLRDTIRASGGIVHSDGNIFFTNGEQFLVAARAALAAPAQAVTPSDATTAVREPCGKIIKILAAIVNSPQSDDQFGNEVLQRGQVMAKVMEIKAQVDAIYKAAPLPIHDAAHTNNQAAHEAVF